MVEINGIRTIGANCKKSRTILENLSNSFGLFFFSFEIYGSLVTNV
jgi:hypothetical protein